MVLPTPLRYQVKGEDQLLQIFSVIIAIKNSYLQLLIYEISTLFFFEARNLRPYFQNVTYLICYVGNSLDFLKAIGTCLGMSADSAESSYLGLACIISSRARLELHHRAESSPTLKLTSRAQLGLIVGLSSSSSPTVLFLEPLGS